MEKIFHININPCLIILSPNILRNHQYRKLCPNLKNQNICEPFLIHTLFLINAIISKDKRYFKSGEGTVLLNLYDFFPPILDRCLLEPLQQRKKKGYYRKKLQIVL